LKTRTDFNGFTTTYQYEEFNDRLALRQYPDGSQASFTYTATGQRASSTDERGATLYAYDLRDRLTSLTYPDGRKLEYAYDENGNRTRLAATTGATVLTTAYTYDDAGRLDTVTDPEGRVYDYGYDDNGNRTSLAYPNGTSTAYAYDALDRLTDLTTAGPGGTIQSYRFTLGPAGNRVKIEEQAGVVREYGYDDLYRLTREKVSNVSGLVYEKTFSYDPVGNRLEQATAGIGAGTISYAYDDRDRLLTENATIYSWDDNGNLVTKSGEANYTWDFENRLVRVELTDGTVVTHTYDADGNRVRTTTTLAGGATTTTDYLVDPSGPLSQVVAETDGSGSLTAYYVRGDDLLAVMRGSQTRFYHADGLGSIRRLTDESGTITDSYTYSAFGELLNHAGSDPQPYLFAGEPLDPNSGFYYNRARWMDPRVGRFVGLDPRAGSVFDPLTLHRFLYVHNDPTDRTDPSGQWNSFATVVTVAVISGIIGAISGYNAGGARLAVERGLYYAAAGYFIAALAVEAFAVAITFGATALGGMKVALGTGENLEQFAAEVEGVTYRTWGATSFRTEFFNVMSNPRNQIHFNLTLPNGSMINAPAAIQEVQVAAVPRVTSWEIYQISLHPEWWSRITWWYNGQMVANPLR
jgi:RHS repeat-associated protein